MILEATLSADYSPGTNQSGDLACADWRFLLPSMSLERVVCIGAPRPSALKVLATMASRVVIIGAVPTIAKRADQDCIIEQGDASFEFEPNSVSLVLISAPSALERIRRDEAYVGELVQALTHDGCIYLEQSGVDSLLGKDRNLKKWVSSSFDGSAQAFWFTKKSGEVRTGVAVNERDISSYFFENVLHGLSLKKRLLSRAGRLASRLGVMPYLNDGRGMLIRKTQGHGLSQPPEFLCKLATENGVNIDRYRFGLAARGVYNSNKIIFHLFKENEREADIVIKMTRVTEFNVRLEHEWEMLSLVQDKEFVKSGRYPKPLFFGYHNGLAVLAQQAMRGHPFRTQTTARPDCLLAKDALDWITSLGCNSADTSVAASADVSRALKRLFEQFTAIYEFEPKYASFLSGQIDAVSKSEAAFPVLFVHGDAGSWNVVADHEQHAVFLDWEAAEPRGMPLWDLFYFFRSFGNWVSRQREGELDTLKNFDKNFFQRGDLNDLLVHATHHYCELVGLERSLVAPMFYTCWMHRALRQATWADSLNEAHFINALRMSIDNRDSPGLRALFGAD